MKTFFGIAAVAALSLVASAPALADAVVLTDPLAPTSNFSNPGPTATAGYNLSLTDSGSPYVYVRIDQTGGQAAGNFANLYFDLNPTVGDGSDLGFELGTGGADAFIPGKNGMAGFMTALDPSQYTFGTYTDATGMSHISLALTKALFTGPIAGLNYYGPSDDCGGGTPCPTQTFESSVDLRLSQSLSYSVAGGDTYGPHRLGSVNVGTAPSGAVPEPATWAMMLVGFGAVGATMRKRRSTTLAAAV